MKSIKFILIIICVFLLGSFSWGMLSVNEAMSVIRQFENAQDLPLQYLGLDVDLDPFDMPVEIPVGDFHQEPWPCYVFKTNQQDNSPPRYYIVEPVTGQIIAYYNPSAEVSPPTPEGRLSDMISKEEAKTAAINFLKRLHPDFDPSQYKITGGGPPRYPEFGNPQFPFEERYSKTLDVYFYLPPIEHPQFGKIYNFLSFFGVELDSTTGNVISFRGDSFLPLTISPNPTISKEQARDIALGVFANPPFYPYVDYAYGEPLGLVISLAPGDLPPTQRLIWNVDIYTYSNNPQYQEEFGSPSTPFEWWVAIDAHTGEVLQVERGYSLGRREGGIPSKEQKALFAKARKFKNPWRVCRKKDDKGFDVLLYPKVVGGKLYIATTQAWLFSVLVEERGNEIMLRNNSKTLKLSGKDRVKINGKEYIPLDKVLQVGGYEGRYLREEKTVYIERRNGK
ncbi:MAG: PepSY domain-containing protein [bacterium]